MLDDHTAKEDDRVLRERLQEPVAHADGALATQHYSAHSSSRPEHPGAMTYAEFLAWCPDGVQAEWIDGEVIVMIPASLRHQQIVAFLVALIGEYVKRHNLGEVLPAPYQMKLPEQRRGREPDLLYVAVEHLDRLTETSLDGPADIAVEVISPESRGRDRGEKFVEYEAARVLEYWLIDPQREQAEFYRLDAGGRYELAGAGHIGRYTSPVLSQLTMEIEWLWQQPLPSIIDILSAAESGEQPT